MISATAFSMDFFVMMSRGLRSAFTASTSTRADSAADVTFSSSGFALVDEKRSDMPGASNDELMVFAVYMPPHEPLDGHAFLSMPSKSSFDIRPAENSPTASNDDTMVKSTPYQLPGRSVPP